MSYSFELCVLHFEFIFVMVYLVLIRHGESLWNAKGLWTGLTDISLSKKGRVESRLAGEKIKDIPVNIVFTSALTRAKETWEEIKKTQGRLFPHVIKDKALNERDYGIYTGKNKWQIQESLGKEQFQKLRRSWDFAITNGESLKDVYSRVIPYFQKEILPKLQAGKNILISAHGNSLRALVKYLENISDNQISQLEIPTGQVYVYKIDESGKITSKEIR